MPTILSERVVKWWARFALPTLVIAQSSIVGSFREEWPAAVAPAAGRWRSDRAHPEQFALPRSVIASAPFIGPGWLPEQSGSLHKAGSTKMAQTSTTTAGIDTSKHKLDIAVYGRTGCWQVSNTVAGWRLLAGQLSKTGVTRVGIEATGGYERGVVEHLRAAGLVVLVLQPIQVKAFGRVHLRRGDSRLRLQRPGRRPSLGP